MSSSDARTRAELVRRRRREQASTRLSASAAGAARPVMPITTRRQPSTLKGGRAAVRRHSDASFSMPGIEVQLPAISFSGEGAKSRFMSFGLSLLLGGALYMAGTSSVFTATSVEVSGSQRIAPEEINAVLGVSGQQVFALAPSELERTLRLNFPDISAARVVVGLPNHVQVDLVERTPVLEWHQDGGYTWIDDSGVAFRPRGTVEGIIAVQAQDAPRLTEAQYPDPLAPQPLLPAQLVAAVKALAPRAPEGATLLYDSRYGLGWTDTRGWQVFFGDDPRDMTLKLQVYGSLVNMLSSRGTRPAFISVQYPTAPYYRMTQ